MFRVRLTVKLRTAAPPPTHRPLRGAGVRRAIIYEYSVNSIIQPKDISFLLPVACVLQGSFKKLSTTRMSQEPHDSPPGLVSWPGSYLKSSASRVESATSRRAVRRVANRVSRESSLVVVSPSRVRVSARQGQSHRKSRIFPPSRELSRAVESRESRVASRELRVEIREF